jgi:elongator complex protein 1
LKSTDEDLEIPSDDLDDERTRSIERGSKLVNVMPSIFSVVLQAPRGNLETVCPRALVLASVRHNINKLGFRSAFMTCRTHRVDMNILHNHNEDLFLMNVAEFVKQLHEVDYIDLFLSSLRHVDRWFSADNSEPASNAESDASSKSVVDKLQSKVSIICDAILAELTIRYSDTHTQSILTAHLSKLPPDVPSALQVIARLQGIPRHYNVDIRRKLGSR